ncbi:uncharacterized protein LOC134280282 [Saccostrea cucullata]|uniref:uncharacterized protein LOC134280282 n=1 Tax=Saccostrea cuccullata TaxID=36930 RepID=UPI002ED31346
MIVVVIDKLKVIEEKEFQYRSKNVYICCKLWMQPSSECMLVSRFQFEHKNIINDDKLSAIERQIKDNANNLLEKHSNLEIISACAYHSTNNGEIIYFVPCIVLHCSCKGVVPYEEKEFPKELNGIKTDVRGGFFYSFPNESYFKRASDVLNPLMMGASIGKTDENNEGTLGGFVALSTGDMGFITCGHVLCNFSSNRSQQKTALEVVQPSYGYRNTNSTSGLHIKSVLQFHRGVTVDASLVRLDDRVSQRGLFAELMANDLLEAGFSLENIPEYSTGATRDYCRTHTKRTNLCIKCGARSGLTKGSLSVNGMAARCRDAHLCLTNPPSQNAQVYLSQLENTGIPPKPFALQGDSGALVFQVDPRNNEDGDDHLFCIGMVVGGTSYYTTVVTPIEPILESLNVKLHVFQQEGMET